MGNWYICREVKANSMPVRVTWNIHMAEHTHIFLKTLAYLVRRTSCTKLQRCLYCFAFFSKLLKLYFEPEGPSNKTLTQQAWPLTILKTFHQNLQDQIWKTWPLWRMCCLFSFNSSPSLQNSLVVNCRDEIWKNRFISSSWIVSTRHLSLSWELPHLLMAGCWERDPWPVLLWEKLRGPLG